MPGKDDDLISAEARRIMQAYPEVYGTGPWPARKCLLGAGFDCGRGWYPLIERLSADLARIVREDGLADFTTIDVWEKLGGLRFHAKGGNIRTQQRIAAAEEESSWTCENCGRVPARLCLENGWLICLCRECMAAHS